MHIIEIRGREYRYRDMPQLNALIVSRMQDLDRKELVHKQGIADIRDEKRTIARLMGVKVKPSHPVAQAGDIERVSA